MIAQAFQVFSHNNVISITGNLGTNEVRSVLSEIYKRVYKQGYQDIVLDFKNCHAVFSGSMISIASAVMDYRLDGVDTEIILPINSTLRALFINANWGHLLSPSTYPQSEFKGYTHVPAICYRNGQEQHNAVNRIMDIVLRALSGFSRSHLTAIDWSINEITDNVLNHSQSRIGGIIQISSFKKHKSAIEYAVCDGGVGIPQTLRNSLKLSDDAKALDYAIREGVTRDKSIGQGNGLYGSWRIAQLSGGIFEIHSGYSSLISHPIRGLHIKKQSIPLCGALVISRINYDKPLILEEALKFQGKSHNPEDYISMKFGDDNETLTFGLLEESTGLGTRQSGKQIRQKIGNIIEISHAKKVVIDCKNVSLVSSSFADEAFGKLILQLGDTFHNRIEFSNVDRLVKDIINRAVDQRINKFLSHI